MESNPYSVRRQAGTVSLWNDRPPALTTLDLELTERCNNDCIHCYINLPADDAAAQHHELTTAEWLQVLRQAAALGCLTVRFTGGEPLLREDFEELYLAARRLGLKVLLFTNGTLIEPRLAGLLARLPPLEKVEVSVYGMRRESYEAVSRTPGSFETAWRGMHLLLERGVPFVVKSALLPPNRREMEEFEAWAAALPWMGQLPSYSMYFDLRGRRDSARKNRLIEKLRLTPEAGLAVEVRRREAFWAEMQRFCSQFLSVPGDRLFSCGSGLGGGCVDAYGRLQLCMGLRHPDTVYDLKSGSLEDGVRNFFPTVRARRAENPDYLARCARCFLKGLCEQCPAKSWTEHGTLDTPVDYLCAIAHAYARYLGLVSRDEMAWQVSDWESRVHALSSRDAPVETNVRAG
jgi:radical SAM protein with 4Fe4S-binding SPASM domain